MSQERRKKEASTPASRPLEVLTTLPPDAYLNPEEVRIYAHLQSRQAVYNWLTHPTEPLPATKAGGWKIRRQDLDAYLKKKQNRRPDEQAAQNTSDEILRRQLGQLIELGKTALEWKRAGAMLRAADGTFDLEFIEERYVVLTQKGAQLTSQLDGISERTLSSLRFMLPSIHSDLALPQEETDNDEPMVLLLNQPAARTGR
jgi:hypothetical protein